MHINLALVTAFFLSKPQPPTKTKEEKPDMIALKAQKYEDCRDEWQDAVLWDRIQTRVETMTPKTPAVEKRSVHDKARIKCK